MSHATGGLADIVAGQTSVSEVTQQGLRYRGYEIADLAEHCSYEEAAYLLLHGELPKRDQLEAFSRRIAAMLNLPTEVEQAMSLIPVEVPLMEVLRTGVSLLGHFDPDRDDSSHAANLRKSERLLGQIPALIALHLARRDRRPVGRIEATGSHAGHLLQLMTGHKPDAQATRVMDLTLVLYAEHEFNASTFAARVIVSTLSDLHSGVVGAIGALRGPLHGGANEAAMEMLLEIDSPVRAEPWVREAFAAKRKLMGFGHRVYKHGDHRAKILEGPASQLLESKGLGRFNQIAATVAGIMSDEKHIFPNLDWPAARAYYAMGLPIDSYTPIFVASRVAGWCAHIAEQLDDNRLIRPSSEYIGPPPREVVPLAQRA